MKSRRNFGGTVVLAAILAVGWLALPAQAGDQRKDQRGPEGLSERVLRELRTILGNEEKVLQSLADIRTRLDDLSKAFANVPNACLKPDLVPVSATGATTPESYCDIVENELIVGVRNQGQAAANQSTLRVTFSTSAGPVVMEAITPSLPVGSPFFSAFSLPGECSDLLLPTPHACNFQIFADAFGQVDEGDEINNVVSGVCSPNP